MSSQKKNNIIKMKVIKVERITKTHLLTTFLNAKSQDITNDTAWERRN